MEYPARTWGQYPWWIVPSNRPTDVDSHYSPAFLCSWYSLLIYLCTLLFGFLPIAQAPAPSHDHFFLLKLRVTFPEVSSIWNFHGLPHLFPIFIFSNINISALSILFKTATQSPFPLYFPFKHSLPCKPPLGGHSSKAVSILPWIQKFKF